MRITLLATGSRGDVQPFLALAYGLSQAGHAVEFVTNAVFETWVRQYELDFRPIHWDPQETLRNQPPPTGLNRRVLREARRYNQSVKEIFTRAQRESWEICRESQYLVYSFISPWGGSLAEKLGIPAICGTLHPVTPTRAFPTQLLLANLGGPLNLLTHYLAEQLLWQLVRLPINRFRVDVLDLHPIRFPRTPFDGLRHGETPLLCALSPTVIPRPPDWPAWVHMQGYWFLPASSSWAPSAGLLCFLEQGSPPVYIGFGSMVYPDAGELAQLVIRALKLSGQRGVLVRGWGGLQVEAQVPEGIFLLDEAPHDWLFPHMAALVHHGGAGTTAAGLRAGVPTVVIPHMQDQPYWGKKLYELGVGPRPIPEARLTAEGLAQSLVVATQDQAIRERAREIGERIRAERGVESAVSVIEEYFGRM